MMKGAAENIKVLVRVRPLIAREHEFNKKNKQASAFPPGIGWRTDGNAIVQVRDAKGSDLPAEEKEWKFDMVFGREASTDDVYDAAAKELVESTCEGKNGTIFAYGQTSSGKTHTMLGNDDQPGLIPLAVEEIFRIISNDPDRQYLLRVSMIELYNEALSDLLDPNSTTEVKIREDRSKGVYVEGAKEEIVNDPEQVMAAINAGLGRRHVSATALNAVSSRSHSVFRMVIESSPNHETAAANAAASVKISVLNLVDLAGSERVAQSQVKGVGLKEATKINGSLLVLSSVISKLSEGRKQHIPFRDSKLTRLLQNSLGGNSRTTVCCNMTPHFQHCEESISTLRFATRAKKVVNHAIVNETMDDKSLLLKYRQQILELTEQLEAQKAAGGGVAPSPEEAKNNEILREELHKQEEEKEIMNSKLERLGKMILTSALSKWNTGFTALTPAQKKQRAESKAVSLAAKWRLKARSSTLDKVQAQSKSQIDELSNKIKTEKEAAEQTQREMNRVKSDHSDLQRRYDDLQGRLRDAEARLARSEEANARLKAEAEASRQSASAAKKDLAEARQRTLILEQKLATIAPDDQSIWEDIDADVAAGAEDDDLGIQGLAQLRSAVGMLCDLAEGWKGDEHGGAEDQAAVQVSS